MNVCMCVKVCVCECVCICDVSFQKNSNIIESLAFVPAKHIEVRGSLAVVIVVQQIPEDLKNSKIHCW